MGDQVMDVSSSGLKRNAIQAGLSSSIDELDMTLTGTAMGQGGAGDGNADATMPIYQSPSPMTMFGKKTSTYRKVHRPITFGLAHTWVAVAATGPPAEAQRFLTTPLAEIPWQKPFAYMTDSEFNLLPAGSYCSELRVKIVCRGVRIAFETAAVATTLATLNQIQNIQVGFGLNKTGWGVDRAYTAFGTGGNTMVPTAVGQPNYNSYAGLMYGPTNSAILPGFASGNIANSQIGFKFPLQNYFTLVTKTQNFGGTPPLVEKISVYDGKTAINQVVGEFSWKPRHGMLKPPLKHIRWGLPTNNTTGPTLDVHTNGNISRGYTVNINAQSSDGTGDGTTVALTTSTISNQNEVTPIPNGFEYLDDIDKSQFWKQGPWGLDVNPEVQPSIHVGVQAIPALTTSTFFGAPTTFTDSQCDWEIVCEMDVVEFTPTGLPFATAPNVAAGDALYRTMPYNGAATTAPNSTNACTFAGLYPTNGILA